jgi:hypothetical protein
MKYIFHILFHFLILSANAQYHWDKVLQINGQFPANELTGLAVAIDGSDNRYLLSRFINQVNLDTIQLTTSNHASFLLKMNADDSIYYFKKIAESVNPMGSHMITDQSNNFLLSINFKDSVLFDNIMEFGHGAGLNCFLLGKFDEYDNLVFKKNFYTNGIASVSSIQTDKNNNIYLLGAIGDSVGNYIVFDNDTIFNNTTYQTFLTKLDSNGTHIFTKIINGNLLGAVALYVDESENTFVGGSSYGLQILFDSTSYITPNNYDTHAFVAKFSASGQFEWARSVGINIYPSSMYIHKITGHNNQIYFTGSSFSNMQASIMFEGGGSFVNTSGNNYFIGSYDGFGNCKWKKGSDCAGSETVPHCAMDKNGNLCVSGAFDASIYFPDTLLNYAAKDVLFASYDSNGNYLSSAAAGGLYNEYAQGMVIDNSGHVYIAGGTGSNPCTFGSIDISPTSPSSIFVARLSKNPSFDPEQEKTNIKVYPNPVNDHLFIELHSEKNTSIEMYNLFSQKVHQYSGKQTNVKIDCSQFSSGLYVLKITENNKK